MQSKSEPALRLARAGRARGVAAHGRARSPAPHRRHVERNPGTPLDLDVVRALRVNRSAVERRAATIPTRRTVKKEWQAAWLLRAITLIDLTTLSGDDTPGNVRRLCAKARHPLRDDLLEALGVGDLGITRRRGLRLSRARADGGRGARGHAAFRSPRCRPAFPPASRRSSSASTRSARRSRPAREEIDIVITRAHVLTGNWQALYDEVRAFREACGDAHMKTILATGELATLGNVARASMVCDDGRRRLHQDVDRQGRRQRDAAVRRS